MRKAKIIAFTALALVALMMFSACNFFGASESEDLKLTDIIDLPQNDDMSTSYNQWQELTVLNDADYITTRGGLMLIEQSVTDNYMSFDRFIVYDAKSDRTVFDATETINTSIDISILNLNDKPFFVVSTTTYEYLDSAVNYDAYEVQTTLYDANGTMIASIDRTTSASVVADYVLFDGKYYSVNEEGQFIYAFDRPDFGKQLSGSVYASNDKYYYTRSGSYYGAIEIFDKQLNYVNSYSFPSYATSSGYYNFGVLNNGKIMLQYSYPVDQNSDDYDVFDSSDNSKNNLVTLIFDPATGEETEIDCQYVVYFAGSALSAGCGSSNDPIVVLYPIVDKYLDSSTDKLQLATVNENGEFRSIEGINGKVAVPDEIINSQYWIASLTDGTSLLMKADGSVVGDITGYDDVNNKYVLSNGKIFNLELTKLYDYEAEGYSVSRVFDDSVILYNDEGQCVIYANDTLTTLWEADASKQIVNKGSGSFIVSDYSDLLNPRYVVYNTLGEQIFDFDAGLQEISVEYYSSGEDYEIIRVYFWNLEKLEYDYIYYKVY